MKIKDRLYVLTHWEHWDYRAKYIPLIPAWLWYCVRAKSLWFFTPSNPTLTFGGFEGESKKEMYDQLPPGSYPKSVFISHAMAFKEAEKLQVANGLSFPFVVKPDAGMMGFLVRKITNPEEFRSYHEQMPAAYILQELVTYPIEISVFYYRFPGEQQGHITGFVRKEPMEVKGDGRKTLLQLAQEHPRARFRMGEIRSKHANRLGEVIGAGEIVSLSSAANLSRGGKLVSLSHEKDDSLLKVFDDLSHYAKHFYYGRYDIKCASVEDLKKGRNFSILEFNGSGAEPHHIYGNGNTLLEAHTILLRHWKVLYTISKLNYARGIKYWKFSTGLRHLKLARKHFKSLKELDAKIFLADF